jgi:hypothetical protein
MIVHLQPWEYEYASHIGIRRYTANWGKKDAKHYSNKKKQEDNRTAQVASAIGELAVAKAVNQYWPATIWTGEQHDNYKQLPDVGSNIEVRRVRTQNAVCIRKGDTGRNLIVFAVRPIEKEFREVEVFGFIHADEGYKIGTPVEYGHVVPLTELRTDFSWFEDIKI